MASSRAPARSSGLPGYDAADFAKHAALVSPGPELAVTSLAGSRL